MILSMDVQFTLDPVPTYLESGIRRDVWKSQISRVVCVQYRFSDVDEQFLC